MLFIDSVNLSKDVVDTSETFTISVAVTEINDYPYFEFPFSNESLTENLIEISEVVDVGCEYMKVKCER